MVEFPVKVYGGLARCVTHMIELRDNGRLGKYDFYISPQFVEANFLCLRCLEENNEERKAGLAITKNSQSEKIVFFAKQTGYKLSEVEQQDAVPLEDVEEN